MPFDPKLVRPDEAPLNDAGDLALPDDLLELAAQLGDDAQHLAKVYPAPCGHLPCGHLAPRDESVITAGSSTRQVAFPHAEREGHEQSIGFLSAVSDDVGHVSNVPAAATASPVPGHVKNVPHIRRTSRRLLRAVALVASLAAMIVSATLWYPHNNDNQPQPRDLAVAPPNTDNTLATRDAESTLEPASPNPQSAISNQQSLPAAAPPPAASRDTFLHEYSGPELEGLYDLIGDSEDDKISI